MLEIYLLHPIVVHFTIGIFAAALLLEILGALFKRESLKAAATWNLYLAALSVIFSFVTGLLAASRVPHNDQAHQIMETHETLGYVILGFILLLALWRLLLPSRFLARLEKLHLLVGLVGFGVMIYSGYLGGEMVYTHGVAVAPVSRLLQSQGHEHGEGVTHHHESDQPAEKAESGIPEEEKAPEQSHEEKPHEHTHDQAHSDHQHK